MDSGPLSFPSQPQIIQPGIPKEILELLLDASTSIDKIRHNLMGEVLVVKKIVNPDDGTELYTSEYKDIGSRCMNDVGVSNIVSYLDGYINSETTFTNLKENRINMIMKGVDKNITRLFYENKEAWAIDQSVMTAKKDMICDLIYCALCKSQNGKMVESLLKSWQISEDRTPQEKMGLGSLLMGGLSPLKKGGNY